VIPFHKIHAAELTQSEFVLDNECEYKFVFMLFTEERPFRLYAQTKVERDTWL
jgi:hypothetical protein